MLILSLDQSLSCTGYAIFDNNKVIKTGTIQPKKILPLEQRLSEIITAINDLYKIYNFNQIYFEDIQQQNNNVLTYKKLVMVYTIVMMWGYWNDIKTESLAPSHWRSVLKDKFKVSFGRKRAEQKKAAQNFVKNHFNLDVTEDEADAICLGYAAIQEKKKESAF